MDDKNGFVITNRDRVLRAWENSTELIRDYQLYAHEMEEDENLSQMFGEFAEDEAMHASKLLEVLRKMK